MVTGDKHERGIARHDISAVLLDKGFIFLSQQSEKEVAGILESLGEVIHVTDVKINPQSRALVTSPKALDFHTDHHKARWVLLHCLEQTDVGGESIIVDAARVYNKLGDDNRRALTEIILFEHDVFGSGKDSHPLVEKENGTLRFYYSFWMADDNMPAHQKSAFMAFREAVAEEESVKLKLQKGDVLVVDNHRMLHGRCAIKGSQDRFLKRFWIQEN